MDRAVAATATARRASHRRPVQAMSATSYPNTEDRGMVRTCSRGGYCPSTATSFSHKEPWVSAQVTTVASRTSCSRCAAPKSP